MKTATQRCRSTVGLAQQGTLAGLCTVSAALLGVVRPFRYAGAMTRPAPHHAPTLAGATLVLLVGCSGGPTDPGKSPSTPTAGDTAAAVDDPSPDRDTGTDTADPDDTGIPERPPPYCRSLDPEWRARYTGDLDGALADVIAAHGLEGDGRVYVTDDGVCAWRDLPEIDEPVPQLGRALFFSLDLSGDRDVACATCHHPELGGGDAISLSVGPGRPAHLMGADRVRGLSDLSLVHLARNSPTTFNVGLWDRALFWDGRVEALTPTPGVNGAGSEIVAEDLYGAVIEGLDADDLPGIQAHLPVADVHEMGGTWGARFDDPADLRDALADRLRDDPAWLARFEAVCGAADLPERWQAPCAAADPDQLVTFPLVAHALAEYQRSQTFTESPWAAYVQGDVDAISDTAKAGALVFYRDLSDGGQGCARCHAGDLFSDERFHAIAGHQLGPGLDDDGADLGRGRATGEPADAYRFRTPTLLNVEATAPYFHAGSMASLTQTVVFYRNIELKVAEYFGTPGEPELHPRPWCRMTQFASIPSCDDLYTVENTHGGDVVGVLDEDAADIADFRGEVSVQVVAFLRTLTDPRVLDAEALQPWVEPDAVLEVTDTSSEWDQYCEVMTERDSAVNLRAKGARWVATGAVIDGLDVNTDARLYDHFGLEYWLQIDPDFGVATGLTRRAEVLAALTLELLTPDQRAVLLDAHRSIIEDGLHQDVLDSRIEVFDAMGALRLGTTSDDTAWQTAHTTVATAEGRVVAAMARAYHDTLVALPAAERDAHRAALAALADGDLSVLPEGIYDPDGPTITSSPDVVAALADLAAAGGLDPSRFVARYTTAWTGPPCRLGFMPRLDEGGRRANYFGFQAWNARALFDLDTGRAGAGPLMMQLSDAIAGYEVDHGLSGLAAAVDRSSLLAQRDLNTARASLADTLTALLDPSLDPASADRLQQQVAEGVEAARTEERAQLDLELDYYVALTRALDTAGDTRLRDFVACIEDPATQAMRGTGGFDARGGGTCVP